MHPSEHHALLLKIDERVDGDAQHNWDVKKRLRHLHLMTAYHPKVMVQTRVDILG